MKFTGLFLLLALVGILCETAQAVPLAISRRDAKFPTQVMVEKQSWDDPLASNQSTIVNDTAGGASAAVATLSSFSAQPDYARTLSITPQGTTGDIEACDIVISGTDILGNSITEAFGFLANATGKKSGTFAFKTVTSVAFPADCESGSFAATWDIGVENKFGVKRCMDRKGDVLFTVSNASREDVLPTMASNLTSVKGNLVQFNGVIDGVNDFVLFFFQNYRCFP